jgi:branched-chain amino acid transport system permease protein
VTILLQQIINGISIGSLYALWAVGFGLVYQILGIFNFSHGDAVVFPVFVAYTLLLAGLPFAVVAPLAILLGAALAIGIERIGCRPLLSRGFSFLGVIATLAIAIILRNVETLSWGVATLTFPYQMPQGTIFIGSIRVTTAAILNIAIATIVVGAFELYLYRSRRGPGILAVAQDRETAAMMGVPVSKTVALVYGLSGAVGVIGALTYVANVQALTVNMGFTITLKAFVAAVLGGIGTVRGAVFGGLLVGICEALIIGFISTRLSEALLYTAMALFLLFRPHGIVGRVETVKL